MGTHSGPNKPKEDLELNISENNQSAGYRIHKYTSTTNGVTVSRTVDAYVLLVGGGGSGGGYSGNGTGGGGGGGGVVETRVRFKKGKTYSFVIGAGGAGVTGYTQGTNGGDTYISASGYTVQGVNGTSRQTPDTIMRNGTYGIRAMGGGGGGRSNDGSGEPAGSDGGCGGGGGGGDANPNGIGGNSTQKRLGLYGYGYAGGTSASSSGDCGAGGGGAGGPGEDFQGSTVGNGYFIDGGIGHASYIEGAKNYYGGGGGAKARNTGDAGLGGLGGGGNGGSNGATNTGGGGGGSESGFNPGSGGSGLIIIKYKSDTNLFSSTGTTDENLGRGSRRGSAVTTYGNATRTSTFGGSWLLDGSGDYVTLPASQRYAFGQNGTIAVWCRWNTTTNFSTNHRVFCTTNSNNGLDLYVHNSGTVYMHGGTVSVSNYTFPKNKWVHVCATYENGTIKIYINGRVMTLGGTATGKNVTNTGTMFLGAYTDGGYNWKGYIDDLNIYSRTLTQRQVKRLRNASRSRKR